MLLEAKGVSKTFRSRRTAESVFAVKNVTITAEPGTFIAIVGESGSGKSTLARLLLDIVAPSDGSVTMDGTDVATMTRPQHAIFRRNVQAVLQDPAGSLNPRKRVNKAVGEVIRLHRIARTRADVEQRIIDVLELVGLSPATAFMDRYPHELSGGQRQRVLIARALALNPRVIIADEAVSALDASVKAGVLSVMADLKQRLGVGYVFITHDLPVVKKVADYVYVMRNGEIVEHNTKAKIFADPAHSYTKTLLAAAPTLD
ncbi:ABC transporter ATP-binding protein [Pseudonocardia sp. DLS-67]